MPVQKKMIGLVLVLLLGFIPYFREAGNYYNEKAAESGERDVLTVKEEVDSLLLRYRDAVRAVEALEIVQQVSASQGIRSGNQVALDTLRAFLEGESLFVMDATGTQLAGSGSVSIGQNYGYRPYFQKAIQGYSYIYPGIGINFKTPRMFFSAPHYGGQRTIPNGIVGLSVGIGKMSDLLKTTKELPVLGLITEDGVVFAATDSDLLYKSVLPVLPERLAEIHRLKQFGDTTIQPGGISIDQSFVEKNGQKYRVIRKAVENTNIEIFALQKWDEWGYFKFVGGASFIYFIVAAISLGLAISIFKIHRQQKWLQESNDLLLEQKKALQQQATHDPLTDLLNRRAAWERLEEEMARGRRTGNQVFVGICDIDHFKKINDTWGHQTGDEVLCAIARLFQQSLRDYDIVARIGGEEFLLVVSDNNGECNACEVFERIRSYVATHSIMTKTGELQLTISIGVVGSNENCDVDMLIGAADRALYRAKNEGRNRVVYNTLE